MKNLNRKIVLFVPIMILCFMCAVGFFITLYRTSDVSYAASKTTMTRKGDTVWFGYYPQTKATAEEFASMSATADENGFFTSGNDKFVKVTSADPKVHSETADTAYIPFDDNTQPVPSETYYFKMEPIEWNVMVDDAEHDTVKLVSRYYLDTHAWQTQHDGDKNTKAGVPENTPANSWRYSEMRAWLNDGFLNFAFSADEQKSILLFANTHTIDYRSNDPSTIVNDYIAIGDRSDYDAAGNNGRPTDYTIVKGATWCYNKDHIYYYVNATFSTFGNGYVRLYRHDEHEKVTSVDSVEAVRPIIYVNRSDAKILATATQKEEQTKNGLLISGIVFAVIGAGLGIPMMVITSAKYKKLKKATGQEYKLSKLEIGLLVPGLVLLIGGCVMIAINIALNGGIGGLGGTKLEPGIYVQQGTAGSGQLGATAYRLNADGTFNHAGYYDGNATVWDIGGTWSQNGSTLTLKGNPNPLYPSGYTLNIPIKSSTSFGTSGADLFKKV